MTVAPLAGCQCAGPFHRLRCITLAEPLRHFAEVEFEAWNVYAAATAKVRHAYAQALKDKKKTFQAELKRAKQAMGKGVSLYVMVSRMDQLMAPPMKAYAAAVAPERKAYWDTFEAEGLKYTARVKAAREALHEAMVLPAAELGADPRFQGLSREALVRVPPLPDWLPSTIRPADRPTRRDLPEGLFLRWMDKAMAALLIFTAVAFLIPNASRPDYWVFASLMGGAGLVILRSGTWNSPLNYAGAAVMIGGGVLGLAAGANPAMSGITIAGGLVFVVLEKAFGHMMRGFPGTKAKGPTEAPPKP